MIYRTEVDSVMNIYGISEELAILIVDLRLSIRELEHRVLILEHGPVDDAF